MREVPQLIFRIVTSESCLEPEGKTVHGQADCEKQEAQGSVNFNRPVDLSINLLRYPKNLGHRNEACEQGCLQHVHLNHQQYGYGLPENNWKLNMEQYL